MPRVRFEPTIPVFEQANTVHALDRAATVFCFLVLPLAIILRRWRVRGILKSSPVCLKILLYRNPFKVLFVTSASQNCSTA
jgi:hypothetical protein